MTLGAYIQVPFCQTKCTYCNFHTGVVARERYVPYADAICREISQAGDLHGEIVDTIYVGGGTPSLLDPAALATILDTLREKYQVEAASEATLEADPETIDLQKSAAWIAAGFNRISMGVQSFHDNELRAAGRVHRRADVFRATEMLRALGLQNIGMDLIAGLPHQTGESWDASIDELIAMRPEHISIYLLEIDEGSRLGRESLAGGARYGAATIPSDDEQAEFYESACARLAIAGYEHYEISNWALPGKHSRHNLKYWRREPYIGFGAGAHSFDGATRWANVHDSMRYVELIGKGASAREQIEPVTPERALDEEIFLGLRELEGIDLNAIAARWNGEFSRREKGLREGIKRLEAEGFVETVGSRVRLAPSRLTVSNEVFVELLNR
ncbi:MAG: radical SAM family heme chaperone HemW [Candidatus Acidiferrales bacterium]